MVIVEELEDSEEEGVKVEDIRGRESKAGAGATGIGREGGEGEEEEEEEGMKVEDRRRQSKSGEGATGIGHEGEEGNDAEWEGFETASEGRDSVMSEEEEEEEEEEESDRSDSESGEVDAKDGARRRVLPEGNDGIEEVENKLRQVGVAEEQRSPSDEGDGQLLGSRVSDGMEEVENKPSSTEEDGQLLQRRIDDAVAAKTRGNTLYAEGRYLEALSSYDLGLSACPLADPEHPGVKEIRAVLHANRAACYSNLQNSDGAVKECTKALELNPNYLKALVRRYQAREQLTNYEDAIGDAKKVLELDPGNTQARIALRRLTPLAEEKREKMKEEMLGKLKEAGNSILGRFGLSVDNFKTVQDPGTGSYSIQFQN